MIYSFEYFTIITKWRFCFIRYSKLILLSPSCFIFKQENELPGDVTYTNKLTKANSDAIFLIPFYQPLIFWCLNDEINLSCIQKQNCIYTGYFFVLVIVPLEKNNMCLYQQQRTILKLKHLDISMNRNSQMFFALYYLVFMERDQWIEEVSSSRLFFAHNY